MRLEPNKPIDGDRETRCAAPPARHRNVCRHVGRIE